MGKVKTLSSVILKYKSLTFKYGVCDCCLFTKDVVEAIHGVKINHPIHRGIRQDFKNIFKEFQAKNTKQFIENILLQNDFKEVEDKTILHGDVVVVKNGRRFISSVCINDRLTSVNENGICILPNLYLEKVYRYMGVNHG
ncbi:MAG: hypothetical protein KC646_10275 [Candidatus Cloacimonetes bacterium]|nr:hypothetical protein [Candidatus Cloacimonadota bacterium]